MSKMFKNSLLFILMIGSIVFMISEPKIVIESVNTALHLWITRVFPVLFPFYIVTTLTIQFGVAHLMGHFLKPLTKILFRTSGMSGFVFFMSLIAGNPSSAIIIKELYENQSITKEEASHLLKFSVFVNPLFVMGTIGILYFENIRIGMLILIGHIGANVVIGLGLRFSRPPLQKDSFSLKAAFGSMEIAQKQNRLTFGERMTKTLQNGMNTLFIIGGFMIFYNIVVSIMKTSLIITYTYPLFMPFHISYEWYHAFFIGMFEMVIGVDYAVKSQLPLRTTVTLIAMLLSFGGLSIHSQIQSILMKMKLKYLPFLLFRSIQMILSGIITFLIFPFIYKETTTSTFSPYPIPIEEHHILFYTILALSLFLLFYHVVIKKEAYKP